MDTGTLVLIRNMQIGPADRVLDFGCGYGAIGIAAAKMCESCTVVMVDVNERAVQAAKKNITLNGVVNARAKQSSFYSSVEEELFDVILSNLPISAGLDVCYRIIEGASAHLVKAGSFQAVSRHRKGGKRIMEKMKQVFGGVEVMARKKGYWVYKSVKRE